jgi:hypothetical protein
MSPFTDEAAVELIPEKIAEALRVLSTTTSATS